MYGRLKGEQHRKEVTRVGREIYTGSKYDASNLIATGNVAAGEVGAFDTAAGELHTPAAGPPHVAR